MKEDELLQEKARLHKVMEQIEEDISICNQKIEDNKESLVDINKSMLSEFKFETEMNVNLEGAATMWHYQSIGKQVENSLDDQMKRKQELLRLEDSAYFAKLVFKEDGEREEDIYIGSSSLVEKEGFDYLIYDWRAPISSIYYDFEEGQASYEAPAGKIKGDVLKKRHFKIVKGNLEYMFDSSINIMDDILKETLAKSVDDKMKTIVTTIQKEQNKIIRDDNAKVLVVKGSAGSGKTSIALHRIAYLLYKNRGKLQPGDVMVFTPNDIFSDYISSVLPELGENNVDTMTFAEYTSYVLNPEEYGLEYVENWHDQMEYLLQGQHDSAYEERVKCIQYKSSEAFMQRIDAYIETLEKETSNFQNIYYEGEVIIHKEELIAPYLRTLGTVPYASRLEQMKNRMFAQIGEVKRKIKKAYKKTLLDSDTYYTESDIRHKVNKYAKRKCKPLYKKIRRMTEYNLLHIYNRFLQQEKLLKLEEKIPYEDTIAMIYMMGRLESIREIQKAKLVVIDEAQDYTWLQYRIFKQLFPNARFTILGDPNQGIHPYSSSNLKRDYTSVLGEKVETVTLTKTYRSTREIWEFCNELLLEKVEVTNVARTGEQVQVHSYKKKENLKPFLKSQLAKEREKGYQSIGIICKTKEHARKVREIFIEENISLLDSEEHKYKSGAIIIPSYLAKGLEFDSVIVVCDDESIYDDKNERKLFYTVCSRALHSLQIIYEEKNPITNFLV